MAEIFEVLGSLSESCEVGSSLSESSELGSSSSVSSSEGVGGGNRRRRKGRASGPDHHFNYTGQFTPDDLREIPIQK